jgi:hypothetical protein
VIFTQLERALIVGSLKFQYLVKLDGAKVIGRQKLPLISVRNVAQGPDGFVYLG